MYGPSDAQEGIATVHAALDAGAGSLDVSLSPEDVAALDLEQAVPADAVAGTRYQPEQMAHLDSER